MPKFTVSAPITIGQTAYSALDMVRYVVDTDRRYNDSAEAARAGIRTVRAFEAGDSVDLQESDLRLLAEVVNRPQRGWGAFKGSQMVPQRDAQGGVRMAAQEVRALVPAREFLPLVDPIVDAAARLPPLGKPAA